MVVSTRSRTSVPTAGPPAPAAATAPPAPGVAPGEGHAPSPPGTNQPAPPTGTTASTYRDLFLDPSNDPYKGNYADVMQAFATTLQPVTEDQARGLQNRVFNTSDEELQAYLLCAQANEVTYLQVVHRPSVLRSPLSRNDPDQLFAFLGDVRGTQPPQLVLWPGSAFSSTNNIAVISNQAIDLALAADASLELLGPFNAGDVGVTVVATRPLMYLPAKYVPIMIGQIWSPRQAWDTLSGAIRNEVPQAQRELEPLLNWLKASLIRFDNTDVVATTKTSPNAPVPLTNRHQDHAAAVLARDLPTPVAAPGVGGLEPLVGAVNQLTAEVVQTRNDEAARRANASHRTAQQHYGQAIDVLLRTCQAGSQRSLPPIYELIANSTKKTLRVNLQQHLQAVASNLGLGHYVPIVTPDLANKLSTANFYHHDVNNLEEGIQPFMTPAWSIQQKEDLVAMVQAHDALQEGASTSLQDILALRAIAKVAPPMTLLQTQHTLHAYRILLHTMLGAEHNHVLAFADFLHQLVQAFPEFEARSLQKAYFCMRLVRYVQIRASNWFNLQVNSTVAIPPPEYSDMIARIRNQDMSWEPLIPRRYLPPSPPTKPPGTKNPAPEGGTTPQKEASNNQRERILNKEYDKTYQPFKDKGFSLQQVRAHGRTENDPVPPNDDGVEMCICFHVLGYCWTNCKRLGDHRPQKPAEKEKLVQWCKAHYV